MKFRVKVICVNDEGVEQRDDMMEMERQELAMETLGLTMAEGKAILHGVQDFVTSQQISEDLNRRRCCPIGMQENQQVVFLSNGGEDIRQVREYLHSNSGHVIDWFHITMRLTVLQQPTKAREEPQPETAAAISKQLESIKHLLWHGNVEETCERMTNLLMDLDLIRDHSAAADKLAAGIGEFETYIRNNQQSIPNYGERYRQGETISTAFVESTINQVVSRRFVKHQQMHWTLRGPHLLLQTRTKVLNDELEDAFRRWYPLFRVQAKAA